MSSGLVDLSLFADSPTVDNHFNNISRTNRCNLYTSATWTDARTPATAERIPTPPPTITTTVVKPLPKAPRRNIYDFCLPTTGSRCVLKRIRRVKLDNVRCDHRRQLQARTRTPSAYATAPSAYVNPNSIPPSPTYNQTSLQGRRNVLENQLALPNENVMMPGSGLPMIWLPDEQMWLVADPTDPSYGFYATGPEYGEEWLPPYTENESPASEESQSDFSPVREQFLSLIEPPRSSHTLNPDEPQMSPLFQEALAGIGMLNFSESSDYSVPSPNLFKQQPISRKPIPSRSELDSPLNNSLRPDYVPQYQNNNSWSPRPDRWDSRPQTPRAASPALRRDANPEKYSTDAEIQRQQERNDRRRMLAQRQHDYNGAIPYGHSQYYQPSGLSRRESWHSDSCSSAVSPLVSPDTLWPVRASSARH